MPALRKMVSHRALVEIVIVTLLLGGAGLAVNAGVREHDARIEAEATAKAAGQSIEQQRAAAAQLEAANEQLQKANEQLTTEATEKDTEIERERAAAQTNGQMAALIAKLTNQPVSLNANGPGGQQEVAAPASSLPALADYATKCEKCENDLQAALDAESNLKAIAANAAQEIQDSKLQIQDVEKERDACRTALKGGTFWQRVKHDAKIVFISAAVGAAVGYAAHR